MSEPERVPLTAIRYIDESGDVDTMVPLRAPDGTWWVLDVAGCSYYDNSGDVRAFVTRWLDDEAAAGDTAHQPTVAAFLALADLMDELDP